MSYCRWSCDDFNCDLYIYEDCDGGFKIHIAGNRLVSDEDRPPLFRGDFSTPEGVRVWVDHHERVMDWVRNAKREPIVLPHAGETIWIETAAQCLDECKRLRELGYRVPDYVFDSLAEDAIGTESGR